MFLVFFLFFLFQRNIESKCASLASVVTPGSPTKKPYSAVAVASNLSKAFKGASFAGRKFAGARNAAKRKVRYFFKTYTLEMSSLMEYLSQTCTSRLCGTRVEILCMCGIATTIYSQLYSKRF
jgi:hypothetical protein